LKKALIVYGTRYGATEMTSEEIADVLRQEELDVRVVNLKNDKVKDISEYELVIVGSGIQITGGLKNPKNSSKNSRKNSQTRKSHFSSAAAAPNH
jgi:flavodoxin